MTRVLSADPGKNSGLALGYFDAITPYRLISRWQVHEGLTGFLDWAAYQAPQFDEIVCEKFILDPKNQFTADLTPVEIEGALRTLQSIDQRFDVPIMWQPRTDKAALTGYPDSAKTKAQRQRVRFDFLDRFGLFARGTENDDSNDAICHALISLKRRLHEPTLHAFWPERRRSPTGNVTPISGALGF